ncbi:serine/threonine-protein kinase [Myxacorys almedinensis]|uniref:non-specific serine/threonine protein kinase n=1 Tax=Myxacorys almedinensis A TaxID=2690445 RepID=A0A8J8CJI0_9CYAN|nr:serine/threonine-protein kinase [Myxacorys almedinensis]NDJ17631.1 CHASE2 domain-containing protein [Myxacorys almedinensis A]
MAKKRTSAGFLHSLTLTLRSGVLKSTAPTPPTVPNHTVTLPDDEAAPTQSEQGSRSGWGLTELGHGLMIFWAIAAGSAIATHFAPVQAWERQAQSVMLRVRGTVAPPEDIVILAVDDESLLQLSGSSWPLRRATYAQAIDKIMQAGAKTVAVDIRWDLPSSFGRDSQSSADCSNDDILVSDDDQQLQAVLQRYDGRVTLAVDLDELEQRQGEQSRISLPFCPFRTAKASLGLIKFPLEPNGRVHRFGQAFLSEESEGMKLLKAENISSFAQATLKAGGIPSVLPKGDSIFFYGRAGTFQRVPFWTVLSPENWNDDYLKQGSIFKDKIVVIGPVASRVGDELNTPFGIMPGVELHANAIAALLQNRSLPSAFPNPAIAGLAVSLLVIGASVLPHQAKHPVARFGWALAIALSWSGVTYVLLTQASMLVPIAAPMGAIALAGVSYLGTGLTRDHRNKQRFRKTLKHYSRSPLVQEMMSGQDEFKDLLQERELEILGKNLGGRYKITKVLGSGGFGETYIAEDIQRPGAPQCVVKQLRPSTNNPKHLRLARRLFQAEAETLERLGEHDQIPRLLAYFEEDQEFYLAQEFIPGPPLSEELSLGRHLPESRIVEVLQELLEVLSFVHSKNVIHRDIKPSNVIKRQSDDKLVLIDFGAVKALHDQIIDSDIPSTATIGIGTQGYMPPEQCAGNPRFNSDIYAVGMMGIQALTGLPPSQLKENPQTGEIQWRDKAIVSPALAAILTKMVHYDFQKRYQSAIAVLQDVTQVSNLSTISLVLDDLLADELLADGLGEDETMTRPWPAAFAEDLPPTEPPPTE